MKRLMARFCGLGTGLSGCRLALLIRQVRSSRADCSAPSCEVWDIEVLRFPRPRRRKHHHPLDHIQIPLENRRLSHSASIMYVITSSALCANNFVRMTERDFWRAAA